MCKIFEFKFQIFPIEIVHMHWFERENFGQGTWKLPLNLRRNLKTAVGASPFDLRMLSAVTL